MKTKAIIVGAIFSCAAQGAMLDLQPQIDAAAAKGGGVVRVEPGEHETKPEDKDWLLKFRIGTCQINDYIVPTPTDGWGYRNLSCGVPDYARFVAPESGVHPSTWRRVLPDEWRRRVKWALGAKEYAVIGTYDDTCDSIFWGIADVSASTNHKHVNEATKDDPYVYYNIVK